MKRTILLIASLLIVSTVWAGDFHVNNSTHLVAYVITDTNGDHVSGQTTRLTVRSWDNVAYLDWHDGAWKSFTSCSTPHKTMLEDSSGGFYYYPVTIDNATMVSGDFVFIVSNDDATYGDLQVEVVNFSALGDLVKIHR